ncbi:hypothetical protein NPIL_254111 [Nephila pilipes]|uniref:Uncharacterized protein n=1 Tax=Nephila pilipes TaxID=299642 RepID=A0A8X6NNJ9_NEPPI|nr:hypothetical protein NPIL_254111 [Nephila pilipes]
MVVFPSSEYLQINFLSPHEEYLNVERMSEYPHQDILSVTNAETRRLTFCFINFNLPRKAKITSFVFIKLKLSACNCKLTSLNFMNKSVKECPNGLNQSQHPMRPARCAAAFLTTTLT